MTLYQFRNLETEQQEHYLRLIIRQRRRLLDEAQHIAETSYRYRDSNTGWACYSRPQDAKAVRAHEYAYGIYLFLFRLEKQMDEIYTEKLNTEYEAMRLKE